MKIVCDVCEAAAAEVVCCADEAALCGGCDLKIHAPPNTTNHQRLLLSAASAMPKCDVCQEALGFFFCLEDRAVLCRKCDIATHKSSSLRATHRRILLTGVGVGLEALESIESSYMHELPVMAELLEFEGNKPGFCKWSSIVQSVEELLNENLGETVDISRIDPETLSTLPVQDFNATSTDTMDMDFNSFANLPIS